MQSSMSRLFGYSLSSTKYAFICALANFIIQTAGLLFFGLFSESMRELPNNDPITFFMMFLIMCLKFLMYIAIIILITAIIPALILLFVRLIFNIKPNKNLKYVVFTILFILLAIAVFTVSILFFGSSEFSYMFIPNLLSCIITSSILTKPIIDSITTISIEEDDLTV